MMSGQLPPRKIVPPDNFPLDDCPRTITPGVNCPREKSRPEQWLPRKIAPRTISPVENCPRKIACSP